MISLLEQLDRDGNGTVSKDEIIEARGWLFTRLDLDRDGTIDRWELEKHRDAIMDRATAMQARLAGEWSRMDIDTDDEVSREEFRSRTVLFDLADRDGDGILSPAEFAFIRTLLLGLRG